MRTAVVIPTIDGREALLTRTIEAYRAEAPHAKLFIVRNRATCGRAWSDGAQAAVAGGFTYVHLAADDIEPHAGAVVFAEQSVDAGVLPSPRILNPDGSLLQCGSLGHGVLLPECATGTPAGTSQFPVLPSDVLTSILPFPDIHYFADDYIAAAARDRGMEVRVARRYSFTHLEGSTGRARLIQRSATDQQTYVQAVAALGGDIGPVEYDRADDDDERG